MSKYGIDIALLNREIRDRKTFEITWAMVDFKYMYQRKS